MSEQCSKCGREVIRIGIDKKEPVLCWTCIIKAELKLPSIDKFIGSDPDFTGDQTTEEYIKDVRGK